MGKLVYCSNCKLLNDCEQAEYCGCCNDGEDLEDNDGDEII